MKVLEERLVYLFTLFCKDLLCSWFHFGSRTFICMWNIFVFPPPLTCCVFFWGMWSCDLFLFSPLIRCECISKCMLDSIWMTKPSSGFVLVFSAICSKTQISLFSCTVSFHSPPGLYSQFLVISPNWRWPVSIIWRYSYISTAWFNGLTISTYPGCLWFHPWFAPSGLFVVAFAVILCGWFHCNVLRISVATHWWNLQYHSIERVTSDYNPVLSSSLPIRSFQWISRTIHLAFVAFFHPSFDWYSWSDSYISRMGDLCHLDKWFRTIGPCVLWFRIWHIQQMKKSDVFEDSDRERLNGCTFNNVFCRTNLGI